MLDTKLIASIDKVLAANKRCLVAIAGPPASGKSTLAQELHQHYSDSVVLPMDGFHLDNRLLQQTGLLPRKGAPETFDADGFIDAITRITTSAPVYVPCFDRAADLAYAAAIKINQQQLIIVEGNYLLFTRPPWQKLIPLWTLSIWLEISLAVVRQRCIARWRKHGLAPAAATRRACKNDCANAELVMQNRHPADIIVNG